MSRVRLTLFDHRTGEVTFEGIVVTRHRPCEVCGHPRFKRTGWCLRDADRGYIVCPHSEDGLRLIGDAGWLHKIDRSKEPGVVSEWKIQRPPNAPLIDAERIVGIHQEDIGDAQVDALAHSLDVSIESLGRLGVGYAKQHAAFSFPMRNAWGSVVGVRLRNMAGEKWAITGSRQGLFYDPDRKPDRRVYICEGPTDTAALLDLGFDAIGRPSCNSGGQIVADLLGRQRRPEVVIVADHDGPGVAGAHGLANLLVSLVGSVRVIEPLRAKDAREWKHKGATNALVEMVANAAPIWKKQVSSLAVGGA